LPFFWSIFSFDINRHQINNSTAQQQL